MVGPCALGFPSPKLSETRFPVGVRSSLLTRVASDCWDVPQVERGLVAIDPAGNGGQIACLLQADSRPVLSGEGRKTTRVEDYPLFCWRPPREPAQQSLLSRRLGGGALQSLETAADEQAPSSEGSSSG